MVSAASWSAGPQRPRGGNACARGRGAERASARAGASGADGPADSTGLANRRGWDEQLARELARARRSSEALSVALLDVDDFKAFNDAHGHQAGDRLLLEAAAAWNGQLRDVDVVCRWGGDDFAVLVPACPCADADEVIARLRAATPRQQFCAAGVPRWDGRETSAGLLRRADKALFDAKGDRQPRISGRAAATTAPAVP